MGEGREAAEAFLVAAVRNQLQAFAREAYGDGVAPGGALRLGEVRECAVECWKVEEG